MGPKVTFSSFTDTNIKVVTGYAAPSGSGGVQVEKVHNVMGSAAGAGSCEFHNYLNAKKRETNRMEEIERKQKEEEESTRLAGIVQRNKLEAEQRTQRNAEKRKRKKEKTVQRKLNNKKQVTINEVGNEEQDNDSDEDKKQLKYDGEKKVKSDS
eukprot:gene8430-11406_t